MRSHRLSRVRADAAAYVQNVCSCWFVRGDRVIDEVQLPGLAPEGPIGLQHHGGYDEKTGTYATDSSLVQFKNVYVRELPRTEASDESR